MGAIIRRRIKMKGRLALSQFESSGHSRDLVFIDDNGRQLGVYPDFVGKRVGGFLETPIEIDGVIEYKNKNPLIKIANFSLLAEPVNRLPRDIENANHAS